MPSAIGPLNSHVTETDFNVGSEETKDGPVVDGFNVLFPVGTPSESLTVPLGTDEVTGPV